MGIKSKVNSEDLRSRNPSNRTANATSEGSKGERLEEEEKKIWYESVYRNLIRCVQR